MDFDVLLIDQMAQKLHQSFDVSLDAQRLFLLLGNGVRTLVLELEENVDEVVAEVVSDFQMALVIEEDVLGLQVDIKNVILVQVLHHREDLLEYLLQMVFVSDRDFFETKGLSVRDYSKNSLFEFYEVIADQVHMAQFGGLEIHQAHDVFVHVFLLHTPLSEVYFLDH